MICSCFERETSCGSYYTGEILACLWFLEGGQNLQSNTTRTAAFNLTSSLAQTKEKLLAILGVFRRDTKRAVTQFAVVRRDTCMFYSLSQQTDRRCPVTTRLRTHVQCSSFALVLAHAAFGTLPVLIYRAQVGLCGVAVCPCWCFSYVGGPSNYTAGRVCLTTRINRISQTSASDDQAVQSAKLMFLLVASTDAPPPPLPPCPRLATLAVRRG